MVRLRCHHGHQDQLEGMSWPRDSPAKSRQRQCWLPQQQQQPPTTTYSRPLAQGVSTTRRPHSPLALSRRRRPRKSCGEFHPHTLAQPTQRSHRDHLPNLKSPYCHPLGVISPPPAPLPPGSSAARSVQHSLQHRSRSLEGGCQGMNQVLRGRKKDRKSTALCSHAAQVKRQVGRGNSRHYPPTSQDSLHLRVHHTHHFKSKPRGSTIRPVAKVIL